MKLDTTLTIDEIVKSSNLAERFSEEDLRKIGLVVYDDWMSDSLSRGEWEDRTADSMKLAMQVAEEKSFPWANASNVKFPLITIAALQYQARAYPALISGTQIVKARVIGADPTGEKATKASRISQFMSYQVLEEDVQWEENMDKALLIQAIVGCAFKKSYFDTFLKHNVSELVLAKDLYIPYYAESMDKASRISHLLYLSKNELIQRERQRIFLKAPLQNSEEGSLENALEDLQEEATGLTKPPEDSSTPHILIEQHRYLDLDDDGYEEPYIVTIHKDSQKVTRIVARFHSSDVQYTRRNNVKEVLYIEGQQYFTKYPFIPSPDGGIYDMGFGVLLGPLNESINTLVNQLIDSGTLSNTAGGFLGRGVKFRSGDNSFKPFEWKRVDSTGDDLRKGVFPLPVREPSSVLYQLLDLLINYGERIGMAVDPLVGVNPGQNTPAETSRNMISEGQKIFSAVFKRTYRSLKQEFRKLYKLNSLFLNDEQDFYSLINEGTNVIYQKDFFGNSKDVVPAADPNVITNEQKLQQAQLLQMAAANTPGYNRYEVEKIFLQAMQIADIEKVFPDPKGPNALPPPAPDPKIVLETMKLKQQDKEFSMDLQFKMYDIQQQIKYLDAEIQNKEAQAVLYLAQADGVQSGHQISAIQNAISLAKQKQDGLVRALEVLSDMDKTRQQNGVTTGGMSNDIKGRVEQLAGPPSDQAGNGFDGGDAASNPSSVG